MARWYDEVDKSGFLTFGRVARSIQTHYLDIINFFERRATNAEAESFLSLIHILIIIRHGQHIAFPS